MDTNVYLHVQQTPKPLAQEPAEVPPLLVHSDLEYKKHFRGCVIIKKQGSGLGHRPLVYG